MSKIIKSIEGLFGQIIHYKDGVKVGESWPGLFEGSQNHYDAEGRYVGYSGRGIIADLVHRDKHGNYIGETYTGIFGQKKHYRADRCYVRETWEDFNCDTTDLSKASDPTDSQGCDASLDGVEW